MFEELFAALRESFLTLQEQSQAKFKIALH